MHKLAITMAVLLAACAAKGGDEIDDRAPSAEACVIAGKAPAPMDGVDPCMIVARQLAASEIAGQRISVAIEWLPRGRVRLELKTGDGSTLAEQELAVMDREIDPAMFENFVAGSIRQIAR